MLLFIEKDSPENPTWETELIPRERWSLKLRERNWRDREGLYRESSGVWFLDRERGEICQRERGGGQWKQNTANKAVWHFVWACKWKILL